MTGKISATHAARAFSDLLNRVHYRGESFLIQRGGETVGQLGPAQSSGCKLEQLFGLLQDLAPPDPEFLTDIRRAKKRQPTLRQSLKKHPWRR